METGNRNRRACWQLKMVRAGGVYSCDGEVEHVLYSATWDMCFLRYANGSDFLPLHLLLFPFCFIYSLQNYICIIYYNYIQQIILLYIDIINIEISTKCDKYVIRSLDWINNAFNQFFLIVGKIFKILFRKSNKFNKKVGSTRHSLNSLDCWNSTQ